MSATIEKKYKLIQMIMSVEDGELLSSIENTLAQAQQFSGTLPSFLEAAKATRKGGTFSELLEVQGVKLMSYIDFRTKADEVAMEDSIEDLLAVLTK